MSYGRTHISGWAPTLFLYLRGQLKTQMSFNKYIHVAKSFT